MFVFCGGLIEWSIDEWWFGSQIVRYTPLKCVQILLEEKLLIRQRFMWGVSVIIVSDLMSERTECRRLRGGTDA